VKKQINSLSDSVSNINLISPVVEKLLSSHGVVTIKDLLFTLPFKYKDTSNILTIEKLKEQGEGSIIGLVENITVLRTHRFVIVKARVSDESGKIDVVWFNQAFLINVIKKGKLYLFEGKVRTKGRFVSLSSPDYEIINEEGELSKVHLGRITPFYSSIERLSSKWLRSRIASLKGKIHELFEENKELADAIYKVHFPDSFDEVNNAREKLADDELLRFALEIERTKKALSGRSARNIKIDKELVKEFIDSLDFILTADQKKAIDEICYDISRDTPMYRLLNGDVGSGKTIVAVIAMLMAIKSDLSVIYLAPTTILAQQHYQNIKKILKKYGTSVVLQIGGGNSFIVNSPTIIIGTHAILYNTHLPQNVGLVIVDEQHRFGVQQREKLKNISYSEALDLFIPDESKHYPHYLTMTATPIPRTLTHILYGDMDVSIIKTMPQDRLPVKTYLIESEKEPDCYKWIHEKIVKSDFKEQAFIIYPLIDDSELSDAKAAKSGYEELSKTVFKDLKVALLHGRMKSEEKDDILMKFKEKKYNILISTSVVEVGIDIPDATMMIIQNAERFGLAQLHQLRGRIGRGELQSHCFLFQGSEEKVTAQKRLKYFCLHNSGFDVAEFDLKHRGPGEVYGTTQSGIPKFKVADIFNLQSLKKARDKAKILLETKTLEEQKEIEEKLFQ